jgi:hypothetical protein
MGAGFAKFAIYYSSGQDFIITLPTGQAFLIPNTANFPFSWDKLTAHLYSNYSDVLGRFCPRFAWGKRRLGRSVIVV